MGEKQYTIEELSEQSGFTRRTIRYYIQEGLLEAPAGRGRGGFYNDSHLTRLRYIKSLQEKGLSLTAIMEYQAVAETTSDTFSRQVWVKCQVIPGLELNVRRDLEQKESRKINEIIRIARALLEENKENG
jgi:DNA-binding transcriptional MerR regulator